VYRFPVLPNKTSAFELMQIGLIKQKQKQTSALELDANAPIVVELGDDPLFFVQVPRAAGGEVCRDYLSGQLSMAVHAMRVCSMHARRHIACTGHTADRQA